MNYAVLFIQTSFKTSKHKKYIPIEKQIFSIHYHETETSKITRLLTLSTQWSATSGVLLNMSAVGLDTASSTFHRVLITFPVLTQHTVTNDVFFIVLYLG